MRFKHRLYLLAGLPIFIVLASLTALHVLCPESQTISAIKLDAASLRPVKKPLNSSFRQKSTTQRIYPNDGAVRESCISTGRLEQIRKSYRHKNIAFDKNYPIKRQVPLAKRLIIIPEKRTEADFKSSQIPTKRNTTPWIVTTKSDLQFDWAKSLPGVRIYGYLPHRAWLIEATYEGLKNTLLHPEVITVEEWRPNDKTHPFVDFLSEKLSPNDSVALNIHAIHPDDLKDINAIIEKNGGNPINHIAAEDASYIHAATPIKALQELANHGAVQWIEEAPARKLFNNISKLDNALYSSTPNETLGLTGKGQIIGHADSGIDTGNLSTIHSDLTNRIVKLTSYTSDGNLADYSGHGTHTAGSAVGDGTITAANRGTAPGATMHSQCIVDANDNFANFGIYTLFNDSYLGNAKIHTDSWGSTGGFGQYLTDSREVDRFVWNHPDFLPFFAAGNDACDSDSNGIIDANSIVPPATAKNCVTIGAAESGRTTGGYSRHKWEVFNSSEESPYPAEPLLSDYLTRSADKVDNQRGMAAFSGRGPTADGRIKPDLVAPGCDILSCASSKKTSSRYVYNIGTSMATPLAAGCGAQIRQYLCSFLNQPNPSAPLVKAMLISGAISLAPGQYGTNAFQEIPFSSPNNVEGWGLIKVGNSLSATNRRVRVIDRLSISKSTPFSTEIKIQNGGNPLSIALSWTDYPATLGSSAILLNDLDLALTCPDGKIIYPNSLTEPDRKNTTETIKLTSANAGTYTLNVTAHSLPYPQTCAALVIAGDTNEDTISSDLTVKYVDATNTNITFYSSTKTIDKTQTGTTDKAPAVLWIPEGDYLEPYVFADWELDGVRQPDAAATAHNPITINMENPHTAIAKYYPLSYGQYFYNNQFVYAWWLERIFNGNATTSQLYWTNDNDGDGHYNAFEMFDNTDPNDPTDIPQKPSIQVDALPTFIEERPPWAVLAKVTDNFITSEVYLQWKHKGDSDWTRTPMYDLGDDLWGAYLAPTNYGASKIDYCVVASDYLQYQLYQETTSTVYSVIGDYPEPWPKLSPESLPELTIEDETADIELILQNLAGADLTWTASLTATPEGDWISAISPDSGNLVAKQSTKIKFTIDGSKLQQTNATATLTITHNEPGTETRILTIKHTQSKTKARGIPISWLNQYDITYSNPQDYEAAVEKDHDNDGFATWEEWHTGTDPTDPTSLLALNTIKIDQNCARLTWHGGTTATQILQYATSLTGEWHNSLTNAPPTPITNTVTLPLNPDKPCQFYRIVVP